MPEIKVSNLHECAWYITKGAIIKAIEGYEVNNKVRCEIYLASPEITKLQAQYFGGTACANIFDFQRASQQINAHVSEAKKQIKRQSDKAAAHES